MIILVLLLALKGWLLAGFFAFLWIENPRETKLIVREEDKSHDQNENQHLH